MMRKWAILIIVFALSAWGGRLAKLSGDNDGAEVTLLPAKQEVGLRLERKQNDTVTRDRWLDRLATLPSRVDLPFGQYTQPIQRLAIASWATDGLERDAEAFLQQMEASHVTQAMREAVLKQAYRAFPRSYLAYGARIESRHDCASLLVRLLARLADNDTTKILSLIREFDLETLEPGLGAAVDPIGCLTNALGIENRTERIKAVGQACRMWARFDASAAWEWVTEGMNGEEQTLALSAIYVSGRQHDIEGLFPHWEAILEALPGHDEEMLVRLGTRYASKDLHAALRASKQLPKGWRRESFLHSILNGSAWEEDPKAVFEALPQGSLVRRAGLHTIIDHLSREDLAGCEQWLSTWTDPAEITQAEQTLRETVAAKQRRVERERAEKTAPKPSMPLPTEHELAVRRWIDFNEGNVLSLLNAEQDYRDRERILKHWIWRDPAQAAAYLENSENRSEQRLREGAEARLRLWQKVKS